MIRPLSVAVVAFLLAPTALAKPYYKDLNADRCAYGEADVYLLRFGLWTDNEGDSYQT